MTGEDAEAYMRGDRDLVVWVLMNNNRHNELNGHIFRTESAAAEWMAQPFGTEKAGYRVEKRWGRLWRCSCPNCGGIHIKTGGLVE